MEALCDLKGSHVLVECASCERRGRYSVRGLMARYGEHASILDVYLRLTASCRWQREVGSRAPNTYGTTCRAKIDLSGGEGSPAGMRSRF